jgi:protein TonB
MAANFVTSHPGVSRMGTVSLAALLVLGGGYILGSQRFELLSLVPPDPTATIEVVREAPPPPPPPPPERRADVRPNPQPTLAPTPSVQDAPINPVVDSIVPSEAVAVAIAPPTPPAPPAPAVITQARPLGAPPQPVYPRRAEQLEKEGRVALRLIVGADGSVQDVIVTEETPTGYGFATEAVKAVRKARFHPKQVDGAAATGEFAYTVRFRLP